MLEKTVRMNYLLDFYQQLLTPKQREYIALYYQEDYALVEIAQKANVSRQAVYDNIKRSETILESYEEKLHMYKKFQERKQLLEQLENKLSESTQKEEVLRMIDELKKIS